MNDYFDPANQDTGARPETPREMPGMKWYKFIIWVQLFLSAAGYVITAITEFTGSAYEREGISAARMFAAFPGLREATLVYVFVLIALALFCIIIRQELAHFKSRGPRDYLCLQGAVIAIDVIFNVVIAGIVASRANVSIGDVLNIPEMIGECAVPVVLLLINRTYFKKREFLFVN